MQSETIWEARWKIALVLAAGAIIAPVCGLVLLAGMTGLPVWFGLLLGLAMIVLSILTLIRPAFLMLDREGFAYGGGWRAPRRYAWSDLEQVYVMRRPRGGQLIGLKYREGRRPDDLADKIGAAVGVDATLPGGWTRSIAGVVARMEAWRTGAV